MTTLTVEQTEKIEAFIKGLKCEVDIMNYIQIEDIDFDNAFNSIYEMVQDNGGFNVEIIYYASAIAYLKENDPSLSESLEIASGLGYEVKNINSEILASLLASQYAVEEFNELQDEINSFFEELTEIEE